MPARRCCADAFGQIYKADRALTHYIHYVNNWSGYIYRNEYRPVYSTDLKACCELSVCDVTLCAR